MRAACRFITFLHTGCAYFGGIFEGANAWRIPDVLILCYTSQLWPELYPLLEKPPQAEQNHPYRIHNTTPNLGDRPESDTGTEMATCNPCFLGVSNQETNNKGWFPSIAPEG